MVALFYCACGAAGTFGLFEGLDEELKKYGVPKARHKLRFYKVEYCYTDEWSDATEVPFMLWCWFPKN
jgi:hypothetical protein